MSFEAFYQQLNLLEEAPVWWLGFSGGLDSHVLLHLLLAATERPTVKAVHINHQLSPNANAWEEHVLSVCEALGVQCVSERVKLPSIGQRGLEDAARAARYQAFEQIVGEQEVLFLAHHLDDQLETMLLRLMRGAGLRGLSGMPRQRPLSQGRVYRPLLDYSRAELASYAEEHELRYITDESNSDPSQDRNYLRLKVLPLLEERWPGYRKSMSTSAELIAQCDHELGMLAQADAKAASVRPEAFGISLDLAYFSGLSAVRRHYLLVYLCNEHGLPLPPRKQLEEIDRGLLDARADASPKIGWPGGELRRFGFRCYMLHTLPKVESSMRIQIDSLPPHGQLNYSVQGVGRLRLSFSETAERHLSVMIRLRQGGERLPRATGGHSKSLKQWFQEKQVPTWLRGRMPLIYQCDDRLCAIGDVWLDPSGPIQQLDIEWGEPTSRFQQ